MENSTADDMFASTEFPREVSSGNTAPADETDTGGIPGPRIILCTFLLLIVVITVAGNTIVLLAFCIEKRLRNTFTYYIFNLALTDLLVALMAMSFYTIDVLLGYWPFGEVLCGIWVFFDYGMTFASVFTLVAISLDRLWSVAWSLHYRKHNTTRKTSYIILIVWFAVLAVWLAPCISDRVKWSEPNVCKWEPSKNGEFVIFVAVIGHHCPCVLLLSCYVRVFWAMRKRALRIKAILKPDTATTTVAGVVEDGMSYEVSAAPGTQFSSIMSRANLDKTAKLQVPVHQSGGEGKQRRSNRKREPGGKHDKERKIFITLSYIIFSYLACWIPFHIVFDISAYNPELVSENVYTFAFWLTYFNSTLNPFLYAYTSKEFRNAFKKVIQCRFK